MSNIVIQNKEYEVKTDKNSLQALLLKVNKLHKELNLHNNFITSLDVSDELGQSKQIQKICQKCVKFFKDILGEQPAKQCLGAKINYIDLMELTKKLILELTILANKLTESQNNLKKINIDV